MRRTFLKGVAGAVALGLVGAGAAGAVTLKEVKDRGYIRVAVANEIPYGFVDPSGAAKGAGPDVAKAVLGKMGIKPDQIQWVVTNFSSLIPGLQANRFDMTAAEMAIRPERCQKVIYSDPNTSYGEGLLVKKGDPKGLHAYSDFKKDGAKVAVMAGADQLQMLQKLGVPQGNIVTIASNADAISTVSTGRADAYAATGLTASELAKKSPKVQVAGGFKDPVIEGKEQRSWGGFTFNKDSKDFRDAFDKELDAFKKTDKWKKILSDYGFTDADIMGSGKKTTADLCK
ncbi:ectoine/hydroxyectoine ABC transporter substrate-binding protein EhuB [Acidimangrovimonas sediminis]|uniref:ectoine/hydroxyectoine ABC transporter substrate-binding protein EhuB n=1 Tax=Acidimangrovimonas sediminis TaxID=2056283 RepID=UPI000C80DDA9|nr:ectoine/hydroxyectoine ABC transporter substrate-binding protein EhuB [Acidimangrovimonas sediminis]